MAGLDRGEKTAALYTQLVTQLRAEIGSGQLGPGAQLPTELALAARYQISRTTVRQALGVLASEGLLERVQGRGTFVRPSPPRGAAGAERRIGLVLTHAGDQLAIELLIGVEQAARSRGFLVSFTYAEHSAALQERAILRLKADGAAGLIVFPLSNIEQDATLAQLQADGTPLVLVDRYLPALDSDYVGADNLGGGYSATEHLLILGHARIGFVHRPVGDRRTSSVRDRWRGYSQALHDYGRPYDEDLVFICPEAGASDDFFDALLGAQSRPTGWFLVTDDLAPPLMRAARRRDLRVPEDLAVVGFDNQSYAAHLSPPLTTVRQPRVEIGLRAGHLLLDRIAGDAEPARHLALPTSLIVRESCGARVHARRAASRGEGMPS